MLSSNYETSELGGINRRNLLSPDHASLAFALVHGSPGPANRFLYI
jgi:hypothetical protein